MASSENAVGLFSSKDEQFCFGYDLLTWISWVVFDAYQDLNIFKIFLQSKSHQLNNVAS